MLPTLDTKLALISTPESLQTVTYSFYEKASNTNYSTIENSATCLELMKQQLSKEIVRRPSRVDKTRDEDEINSIIDNYTIKLINSGHSINQARSIILSGVRCYKRKVKNLRESGVEEHRNLTCPSRRLKKLIKDKTDKTLWYQQKPIHEGNPGRSSGKVIKNLSPQDLRKTIACLAVPRSNNGRLIKSLKETEMKIRTVHTTKVKLVEKDGQNPEVCVGQDQPLDGPSVQHD